jgi:hypothetical protein
MPASHVRGHVPITDRLLMAAAGCGGFDVEHVHVDLDAGRDTAVDGGPVCTGGRVSGAVPGAQREGGDDDGGLGAPAGLRSPRRDGDAGQAQSEGRSDRDAPGELVGAVTVLVGGQ